MDKIGEIVEKIKSGDIKLYQIEDVVDKKTAVEVRRTFLSTVANLEFDKISKFQFEEDKVFGRNCENLVGGTSIPLGIAGPVRVLGDHANGEYYIPLATTEGALVASVNRGSKAITMSGGAKVICTYKGITRAPIFRVENIKQAKELKDWIKDNFDKLIKIANSTDKYLNLKDFDTYSNGKNVWVRFSFETGDAMGMNMAVMASNAMCLYIENELSYVKTLAISGNMCTDKKPAFINSILGRGREVEVEAIIKAELVERYLKCKVDHVLEVHKNKTIIGSMMAGSLGFNAHVANVIAGIYIATGQDPAHVVEGSLTSTNMEKEGEDLYVNVRIPAMNVATVGGGTGLPTQLEAQKIMLANVSTDLSESDNMNKTSKFAEITGAAVLAGELSLHAAFACGSFVKAHEDLGRNGNGKHKG